MNVVIPALVALTALTTAPQEKPAPRPKIEVAFVLDTTSSMTGLIEGAKQKIWSIASSMAKGKPTPDIEIALVAYRDVGDAYVTKRFDFSRDLDSVYGTLRQFRAEGGGDFPEHVGQGLGEAVSKLSWSQDPSVMKTIFLVGDAPPADRHDDWNYQHWAQRAGEKHIVVNTIRCGQAPETARAWQLIASLSNGTFTTIDQSGGMLAVATPYDSDIAKVNADLARHSMYTGSAAVQTENMTRAKAAAELPPEAAAERLSYMGHGAGEGAMAAAPAAIGGARDLVADPGALDKVSKDELPADLKGLSKDEQKKRLEQLATERKELEKKAQKLAAEREEWVAKNAAKKDDSFDSEVFKGVKKQAATYGVAY